MFQSFLWEIADTDNLAVCWKEGSLSITKWVADAAC